MSSNLLRTIAKMQKRFGHSSASVESSVIGTREIVGFGFNGVPNYVDRADFPLPAIRFRPDTPDIKALREKEKGDWKALSIGEKKALYRASFCQTFAEINAPTGEWKSIAGFALCFASLALWAYMGMKLFVYNPTLPESFNEENRQAQLKRILAFRINPVDGISSKYDYENNKWK
ncbi:cytochrome c oxidase subunit 4 isoform 1, mitochondrial [Halyomorpha halys]|uniref:cytochrome c oxidase subunit 4 isoform 1, mitochondrial n=1 Tax=Halyomorpha halys TaxID=286706 RepID=UPI0006D50F94|nr:cytochrome c oxidase subunit 4 isoform 1, mitochondrial [Halyomorpha halys]